jgi:hypothetical protein
MTSVPTYLTQEELKRVFAAVDSPRDRALFGPISHYGLRVSLENLVTEPLARDRGYEFMFVPTHSKTKGSTGGHISPAAVR